MLIRWKICVSAGHLMYVDSNKKFEVIKVSLARLPRLVWEADI